MIVGQKFLAVGAVLVGGAIAMAMIAEALLWAHVHAPSGSSGFYLLSPPTLAVSVADGRQAGRGAADETWPRDPAGR